METRTKLVICELIEEDASSNRKVITSSLMSANIVELISSQIGGSTNRLSSLLGESPERTQQLAGAAVPTLLAGLTHVASTPEGAHRLHNAINEQGPDQEASFSSRLAEG